MYHRGLGADRRRNVSRHKAAFAYDVVWEDEQRAFAIYCNGQQTGLSSEKEQDAIERAIEVAQRHEVLGLNAVVYLVRQGTRQRVA